MKAKVLLALHKNINKLKTLTGYVRKKRYTRVTFQVCGCEKVRLL